jgi:hypothetical protein
MTVLDDHHAVILEKLGELKGQMVTLTSVVEQRREDINGVFLRLGQVEKTGITRDDLAKVEHRVASIEQQIAKWAGICLAASVALPFITPAILRAAHFVGDGAELQKEIDKADRPAPPI